MLTRREFLKKSGRIALVAGVVACFGCAVAVRSVPNPSIVYNIPSIQQQLTAEEIRKIKGKELSKRVLTINDQRAYSSFEKLYQKNPLLAKDLGKLPEFQDGVLPSESSALEKVVNLYHKFPDNFNKIFGEMYNEEYPDIREYCSPLQALLWGYMDDKFKQDDWPMKKNKNILKFVHFVWGVMAGPRWDKFDEVTSRLNLPELVNLYKTKKLVYYPDTGDDAQNPEKTFERKGGDCEDFAIFIACCLEKNGYDAKVLNSWKGGSDGHTVATYKENGKIYVLDNRGWSSKFIGGPFKSYKELGRAIQSNPKRIWVYDWKTFYYNYKRFPFSESLI